MTNKKAIDQLKHMKVFIGYDAESPIVKEMQSALDMAIKALEQTELNPSYNSIKTELKPCEDCVSREEVLNLFRPSEELQDSTLSKHWFDFVSKYINKIPPVKPQPPKGKWIVIEDDLDGINFPSFSCECSECGADFSWKPDFCPNCGADMRGDADETNN